MRYIEIIVYQLASLLIFHVGNYYNLSFYQKNIGLLLLFLILIYYLKIFIQKKGYKYITKWTVLGYLLATVLNYFSLQFLSLNMKKYFYLIDVISVIIVLIFYLISNFIIENVNDVKYKESKLIFIIVFVSLFIPLGYGFLGTKLSYEKCKNLALEFIKKEYVYEDYILNQENSTCDEYICNFEYRPKDVDEYIYVKVNKKNWKVSSKYLYCLNDAECYDKAKVVAEKYLEKKFGKFDYTIDKNRTTDYGGSYEIYFNTEYTNEPFYVVISKIDYQVAEDNFLILYFSKLFNKKFTTMYQLTSYISEKISSDLELELFEKYNAKIIFRSVNFDSDKFDSANFGKLPTYDDLEKFVSCEWPLVIIYEEFSKNDLEKFKEYIVELYEDIKDEDTLFFDFNYKNPFVKLDGAYSTGGYIKDVGSGYLLYLNPQPYKID